MTVDVETDDFRRGEGEAMNHLAEQLWHWAHSIEPDFPGIAQTMRDGAEEIERLRLWLLGFMQQFGEVSDIDILDHHQHNIYHGVVRIAADDGSSEMYFVDNEEDFADWCDSPLGKVEWVVEPKCLSEDKEPTP